MSIQNKKKTLVNIKDICHLGKCHSEIQNQFGIVSECLNEIDSEYGFNIFNGMNSKISKLDNIKKLTDFNTTQAYLAKITMIINDFNKIEPTLIKLVDAQSGDNYLNEQVLILKESLVEISDLLKP